jgi:hypothetical protein
MKKSLVIIHGGSTYDTYEEYWKSIESKTLTIESLSRLDWKDSLAFNLPEFQVLFPKMPNSKNARYLEWKLWFEKLFPLLNEEVVLVGHSLGGIFLAKYLSEHNFFPKKIASIHLVAAPYDTEVITDSLADFALTNKVEKLSKYTNNIFIYQSKDDFAVSLKDAEKYKKDLPNAELIVFEDRGHFTQPEFLELVKNIKK